MKVKREIRILLFASCLVISTVSVADTIEVPERKDSDSFLKIPKIETNQTIIEHKINGRIDSIEIKPALGQSYYLIDNDDILRKGANQSREQNEILSNWRLLQW